MDKIFVSVIEEVIEELKCDIKCKNYYALSNILSFSAENLSVANNEMKLVVREPNHSDKNNGARNTHP